MKRIFITLAISFLVLFSSFSQERSKYSDVLLEMFQVSGGEASYQVVTSQMIQMFKEEYVDIPKEHWENLEKEFLKTSMVDLSIMLEPVYQKYLSLSDLKEVIAFYNTPVGKKFSEKSPLIVQESMQIGQEWGKKIAEKLIRNLDAIKI